MAKRKTKKPGKKAGKKTAGKDAARPGVLLVSAVVIAGLGAVLAAGGGWLMALGGSWYYLIAGAGFLLTAWLLTQGAAAALGVYGAVVAGTLVWALWEAGLDWWGLAPRGGVIFLIGAFLLTPWVTRSLRGKQQVSALRGAGLPLTAALTAAFVVAAAAWFNDTHRITGVVAETATQATAETATDRETQGVPAGEWHAYGRTGHGQRYSPLTQITPANVANLEIAWTYHTGDERGRPGDPVETTFQVTPLKIGNRLFLCTPHQSVIALDATTGAEIWRYDPKILGELALQHLTCRGLSYYAGAGVSVADAMMGAAAKSAIPGWPVAAASAEKTADCAAKLFMPTADGRVIALNPADGAVCRNFGGGAGQVDLWAHMPYVTPGGYYSTSPVVVAQNLIIVSGTVLDNVSTTEPSGVTRAFDVETGQLVWNWDSGNPEQTAPIAEGETYTHNSPNSWSISSADEALGLVYVPLGNQPPDQWGGDRDENTERFSSSVVALDIASGKLRWVFQTVHHDLWDYDVPAQPSLVDLTIDGERVPALVQPTKQGDIYVLDRRTGEPILPVTEVAAPQGAAGGGL